jgi:hypothetical protein
MEVYFRRRRGDVAERFILRFYLDVFDVIELYNRVMKIDFGELKKFLRIINKLNIWFK